MPRFPPKNDALLKCYWPQWNKSSKCLKVIFPYFSYKYAIPNRVAVRHWLSKNWLCESRFFQPSSSHACTAIIKPAFSWTLPSTCGAHGHGRDSHVFGAFGVSWGNQKQGFVQWQNLVTMHTKTECFCRFYKIIYIDIRVEHEILRLNQFRRIPLTKTTVYFLW